MRKYLHLFIEKETKLIDVIEIFKITEILIIVMAIIVTLQLHIDMLV